jgi:hypothetical protein
MVLVVLVVLVVLWPLGCLRFLEFLEIPLALVGLSVLGILIHHVDLLAL